MPISKEKLNIDTLKADANVDLAKTTINKDRDSGDNVSEVDLSLSGLSLSHLYQRSLSTAKQNPSPVYIGSEKRIELLAASVNDIAQNSGHEYTTEQIQRIVEDVTKELNIRELEAGDVNASAGSV